jgi:FkbM family methyltransferase
MAMISYAQNFEDVMLWRALGRVDKGFYIDIGAQDPIVDSVSLAFYEQGWRGIHIEPTHHYATLLRQHRAGETVLETAVGAKAGIIRFYEIPETGISTADENIAQQHRERGFKIVEIDVPCVTLASVFKSCGRKDVHWLKIDVEGLEEQVLAGWKPSKIRPWIVVVESTLPLTQIESHESWEPLLLAYGYSYVYFDGLNRFYVSNEKQELQHAFRAPPNVFDGFSVSGTTSTSIHRVLADLHNKQVENLSVIVADHAVRERAAIESAATIQSSAQDELAKSMRDYKAREIFLREKSEAREKELTSILAAAQAESARRMDSLSQQAVAERLDASAARDQVSALQQTLTAREREFAEQLARAREEADHRLAMTRAELESNARDLITANLRATSQREALVQIQIDAMRAESQALAVKFIEGSQFHAEQLMFVAAQAQENILEQVKAREIREQFLLAAAATERDAAKRAYATATEREQMLVAQAQRDIDAAHTKLKAQLLQMVSQEQMHNDNVLRLHEELRQQLNAQSSFFTKREKDLRSEFAAQISSQHKASEEYKHAALKLEQELGNALNTEKQARDLLNYQLNEIKREVAGAHAYELLLQRDIKSYFQQIAEYRAEISFMRDTLSWRLTSPLRRIAGWVGWRHPRHEKLSNQPGLNAPFLNPPFERDAYATPSANLTSMLSAQNNADADESSPLISYFAETPVANINHVNQLLELYDITFVRAAYQCLLGRAADDMGEGFYLARLRSGIAKADIIFEISQSDEGKRVDVNLAGLREFVSAHPPVGSRGFRSAILRLTRIEHQVNRLENELARASAGYAQTGKPVQDVLQNLESMLHTLHEANDRRFNQIESIVTNLHESVAQQINRVLQQLSVQSLNESSTLSAVRIATPDKVLLTEEAEGLQSAIFTPPAEIECVEPSADESVIAITESESGISNQNGDKLRSEALCLEADRSIDEASWRKYLEGLLESRLIGFMRETGTSPIIGSLIVVVDCSEMTCTQDELDRTQRCLSISLLASEHPMKVVWFDPANELARAGISGATLPNSSTVSDRHELQLLGTDDDVFLVLKPGDEVHPELHMALDYFGAFSADFILIDMYFKESNRIYPFLLHAVDTTHAAFCDYFLGRYAANGQLFRAALRGGGSESLRALGRGICANLDLKGGAIALHIALPLLHIRTSNAELAQLRIGVIVEHTGPGVKLHLDSSASSKTRVAPKAELATMRPKVSVVICTKDCGLLLRQLLNRLELEPLIDDIIIVSNNTTNVYALTTLVTALASAKVKILSHAGPFNFSIQCNLGERHTKNEILLFLNDDIAPITNDWLERLYDWMDEPRIVGPMLIYPNESVQHAGMFLGFHGVAGHVLRHSKLPSGDYGFMLTAPRTVSCLTGAALMMPKGVFAALNGFDPLLGTYLQDVDISLRALNSGVDLVFDPRSILMHMESISVLPKLSDNRILRTRELEFSHFHQRWGQAVKRDLWINPLFSADNESLTLLRA